VSEPEVREILLEGVTVWKQSGGSIGKWFFAPTVERGLEIEIRHVVEPK